MPSGEQKPGVLLHAGNVEVCFREAKACIRSMQVLSQHQSDPAEAKWTWQWKTSHACESAGLTQQVGMLMTQQGMSQQKQEEACRGACRVSRS